ncbi:MAG: LysE family transporter [Alphaproteobacteria bacterium]
MDQFEHYLPGILLAYSFFALGLISPGPNILSIMGTSMSNGRRAGQALALGVSSGSLLWGLLTMFGLAAILALYASVITVIKIAGALYLLWLAYRAFRSAATPDQSALPSAGQLEGHVALYRRGLLIQMTNPKAAFTWIAGMSLALDANAPLWVGAVVTGGTVVANTAAHLVYAMIFSTSPMIAGYRRLRRWIDGALGVFFCFASYRLITAKT